MIKGQLGYQSDRFEAISPVQIGSPTIYSRFDLNSGSSFDHEDILCLC